MFKQELEVHIRRSIFRIDIPALSRHPENRKVFNFQVIQIVLTQCTVQMIMSSPTNFMHKVEDPTIPQSLKVKIHILFTAAVRAFLSLVFETPLCHGKEQNLFILAFNT